MAQEQLINVYRASAGSGKTYTLTHEYIDLILKDEEAYRHVLAVTFTNKATDEMKQRILEELHKMASDPHCARREMAKKVLIRILHDYPAFSVSTIDRFFQGIMRSFARELGRLITYGIELDSDLVRTAAVDNLFADLDKNENRELLKWLIDFSLERIENGESWRIANDISNLSRSLFSEDFKLKNNGAQFTVDEQMKRIARLKKRIAEITSHFEKESVAIGKEALAIMERCGLEPADFKRGMRGPFAIFHYLANGQRVGEPLKLSFVNTYDCIGEWYAKTRKGDAWKFERAYSEGLNDAVGKLIELYDNDSVLYYTALCVKGNLNSLGILGYVYAYILDYCKSQNVMLLSETTELLGQIIDGNDTPFIYEKVGTWINNFMLDEFQDTSLMQWRNFVPLLANSISNGDKNLIVGDVKQSIYRFRNSDWNILESGIDSQFSGSVAHKGLDVNWRSASNIVDFNNGFFEAAAVMAKNEYEPVDIEFEENGSKMGGQIVAIYSDFKQSMPDKGFAGGYVDVNFINKKELEETGLDYEDVVNARILENVSDLISCGFRQKDIGVLVRWNSEGASVAKALVGAGYSVISADSLSVSSSAAVKKVINILKCIEDSNAGSSIVPAEECERLKKMPPYQMCEEIIRCYLTGRQKEDMAFLQAFLDIVIDYFMKQGNNLSAFLKWWDENGAKKSISSPEDQDAIQVMTVHKAKGLAFEAVIVPYFSGRLDHSSWRAPLLWSNMASQELDYDGPLPVRYSSALKETLFCDDYYKEKLEVYVDNLNVAYVAFTRPKRYLSVIAEAPVPDKDGVLPKKAVSHLLYDYLLGESEKQAGSFTKGVKEIESDAIAVETVEFVCGEIVPPVCEDKASYGKFELGTQFEQALDSARIKTSMQTGSINDNLTLRDNGIIMHELFAGINSAADVERLPEGEIKQQILSMIASVEDRGWFSDEYLVFKECSILQQDGSIMRPDRVLVKDSRAIVIDYKFGEFSAYNKKYHKQVQKYMQLLMDMGFTELSGYLWYLKANEIEQVGL